MKNNNYINNELNEDFLLRKIATSLVEKDSLLFDELQNDETIVNPLQDDLDKRISAIINDKSNKEQNVKNYNNVKKTLIKAAVIIFVISSGFVISFTTVDAFRVKVLNYYIENFDTHASFMPKEEKPFMVFKVGYIPVGYLENDEFKSASSYALTYYNQENNMIAITLYDSETVFNVDTENCERYDITINNQNGYIFRKPGTLILVFKFYENSIVISSNDDKLTNEEFIRIAKSIDL
ncbi:DUF4367 domain-containing protein [Methanobacterium sp.]|uniref:DUF4367 domain-containing protein n=1 Tax=Methanobacterium sp. TaxID=2164 RepID=UPI0031587CDA